MSTEHTERGVSDHVAVELYERLARVAAANGTTGPGAMRLLEAHVMRAMMVRWWERRGYTIPPDATQQPGADSPATN